MKNILARGGIEFLAVLLGITASLWIDKNQNENENENERIKILTSLQMEINEINNYCDERKRTWKKDISLLNEFLYPNNGIFSADAIVKMTTSKSRIERFMIIYRVFDPPMNRYHSIINSGDLKYVKSDKVKELLSRLHNTSFSYVKTSVEYEKQLKQSFLSFLAINHSDIILANENTKISIDRYADLLNDAITSDNELKANFIMIKRYLEIKMTQLKLYMINLDDLEREIDLVINN
ncbi:MAG: hypothetical protein QF780_10500 [Candidatus Marinimicrobia bacterium]|nr:hypothetical protein [Candidatus Neomarinimicrobiota bacterium]